MNVQDVLDKKGSDVETINRGASVLQAAELMNRRKIGALVVTEGEKVVGVFTERDIMMRVVGTERDPRQTRIEEVMTAPMACCRRDMALSDCQAIMTAKRIRHLPVVEDGNLYGMISSGDIMASEVEQKQLTIEYLHEYLYRSR